MIGSISNILLYEVIDPDLAGLLVETSIENTARMMESFGAPSSQIDEALAQMETDLQQQFSALGVIKSYGWGLIIYAVLSLITGLIIRKNEPIEDI